MATILIVDKQSWVIDLCRKSLVDQRHEIRATDNIALVRTKPFAFEADIVVLNLYLKHGLFAWDVLRDIKQQDLKLPVIIITAYEEHLFDPRLSQADGYLIDGPLAGDELRKKISVLLERKVTEQSAKQTTAKKLHIV